MVCQFCKEKATGVDYKDTMLLRDPVQGVLDDIEAIGNRDAG